MSNLLPDIQGSRVFFQADIEDTGTVIEDWREELVKVEFDDGDTVWIDRDKLTLIEDDE